MKSRLIVVSFALIALCGCQSSQEPAEMEAAKHACAARGLAWQIESFGILFHGLEKVVCVHGAAR